MKTHQSLYVFIAFTLLLGCANTKKDIITSHQLTGKTLPETIFINTEFMKDINVSLDELGYDGDTLANMLYQANLNASLNSAAYSPAGGLAGALIAGQIIKSTAKSSAKRKKNTPIQLFLDTLENNDWSNLITEAGLADYVEHENVKGRSYIVITPKLSVSIDYRTLNFTALVEVNDSDINVIHRNYYHIEPPPMLSANETITNLNLVDFNLVNTFFISGIHRVLELVKLDIEFTSSYANTPIRVQNERGEFYSRGIQIKACDNTIVFRNLRKEIKELPCSSIPSH
jgi:hypothetical protein